MIGKLTGLVDSLGDDWAIVDVSGVGYLVFGSARTLSGLGAVGEPARLWIETHVREDHIHLYGFVDRDERDWFRLLTGVQGVGAKMALAILSVLAPEQLVQTIAAQDKTGLTRANGVGPKLAGRIVAELKDKVGAIEWGGDRIAAAAMAEGEDANGKLPEDAISALVNLGYRRAEAFGAVAKASRDLGEAATLEGLIREGLRELSS